MEDFLKNLLVYLVAGLALGLLVSMVFIAPPQPAATAPPANPPGQNLTIPNQTPPVQGNLTQPPPNQTPPEKKEVNVTMIEAPDCDQCNSEGYMLEQTKIALLQSTTLETGTSKSIKYPSAEASALIAQYNITELPVVIIGGPVQLDPALVSAWEEQIGTLEGSDALVSRLRIPPFYDIENQTVIGLVKGIGIKATGCLECGDPEMFMASLEGGSIAMVFSNKTIYAENDTEAQAILKRYNITKLPALLLSSEEASAYPAFAQIKTLGTVEPDGWFVVRDMVPPYIDLAANHTLRGIVSAFYIVNSSCTECFDVESLSSYIADSSGLIIANKTTYEANSTEGKALIKRYNITSLPSIIYSPDAKYYPHFEEVWAGQNSTVESDGWFVFRAYGLLGGVVYQNISG